MSILKILVYPNPFLRKATKEFPLVTTQGLLQSHSLRVLKNICCDMEDTLDHSDVGAALAANQVGIDYSIIVTNQSLTSNDKYRADNVYPILINPKIISLSDDKNLSSEGCLSFPNIGMNVERRNNTTIEFDVVDDDGLITHVTEEYTGFWARVFQHEIDHLNGKLFIDFLSVKKRLDLVRRINKKM